MLEKMRKDAEENRVAIVAAARDLFAREGIDVSMRAIAKEAGVGVATATRHFPDRDGLLEAVIGNALASVDAVIAEHMPRFSADPSGTWSDTIHAIVDLALPVVAQQIFPTFAGREMDGIVERNTAELERIYRPLLTAASSRGLCPPDLPAVQFHLGIIALSRPLPAPADKLFPDEMNWLVDVFINGLKP